MMVRHSQVPAAASPAVDEPGWSAQDATRVIQEVSHYEEGLTQRVVGLTLMLWGCVTFGLFFVSYAVAAGGSSVPFPAGFAALAFLILGTILLTNQLWRWRALQGNVGFRPWRIWGQGALLLGTGFAMMIWLDPLLPVDSSVSLAIVATILLGYLGLRLRGAVWSRRPWILYGALALFMADVALMMWAPESLPAPDAWAHLLAATATSLAIFVPGYLHFRGG